jgi:hypothetical protein
MTYFRLISSQLTGERCDSFHAGHTSNPSKSSVKTTNGGKPKNILDLAAVYLKS